MTRMITVIVFMIMMLYPSVTPAGAEPPDTASTKLAEYKRLTGQASQLNENLLNARIDLTKKRAQLHKANDDLIAATTVLKQAKDAKDQYQEGVDQLVSASREGARFSRLSALLTGANPDDFLERAAAIDILSVNKQKTINSMTDTINLAHEALNTSLTLRNTVRDATQDAKDLVDSVKAKKTKLGSKISTVLEAYNRLSGVDKETLAGTTDNSAFIGNPGAGGTAATIAMAQRGKPYVWGAAGPGSFDCSGLVLYAYNQVGISLPHSSRAQYGYGVAVAFGEWKQGDLLFYGGSPGTIHHVTMYVGNGMIVQAATSGTPVKTDKAPYGGGNDYIGAKRLAP